MAPALSRAPERRNQVNYDVDYFIAKFEAIPDEKWITGTFSKAGAKCALGHCGVGCGGSQDRDEGSDLANLFYKKLHASVHETNDGLNPKYPQPTPRARILAALNDIKRQKGNTQ